MKTIEYDKLIKFIKEALMAVGLAKEHAEIVAKSIGFADLQGIDTHGVMRLPIYIQRLKKKLINPNPEIKWTVETETTAVLDGDNGMGHYSAHNAMKKAINKAKKTGIAFVTLYNGNHIGAGSCYTELATKEGLIAFMTTNAGPLMAPTGGIERVLGNNPITISIPRKNKNPISLDMANSVVAGGRLELALSKDEEIPLGWALDKDGKPTKDPAEGLKGVLLPIGNHKGYGLTFMMDIFSSVLSGANFSRNIPHLDEDKITNVGCTMIVLDFRNFIDEDTFYNRLEDFVNGIKNSRKSDDVDKIYLPGEIEKETKDKRLEKGIPVNNELYKKLIQICENLNLNNEIFN